MKKILLFDALCGIIGSIIDTMGNTLSLKNKGERCCEKRY